MGAVGYEHPQLSIENQQEAVPSGAESGAVNPLVWEETLELVKLMANMPKPLRDAVIQIAQATERAGSVPRS